MLTEIIAKLFIKNHSDVTNETVRNRYGIVAGIVGIISNTCLVIIKLVLGVAANSVAIIADAVNNLTDATSSIVTLIGFKLSAKEADEAHPFGHQRIEYITGLIIGLLILIVGINLSIESVKKIIEPTATTFSLITVIGLVISIMIKICQAVFYHKFGKIIHSMTLQASSQDARNDCISTGAVLISTVIMLFVPALQLDGYFGLAVSIFIIISSIKMMIEISNPLIGQLPSKATADKIVEICLSNKKILGYHDLLIHSYGPNRMFASIHLEVDGQENITNIHNVIDDIEYKTKQQTSVMLVVHIDPVEPDNEELTQLKNALTRIIGNIQGVTSFHDLRLVEGKNHIRVLFDIVVEQQILNNEKNQESVKQQISEEIAKINPIYKAHITIDSPIVYQQEQD